jgi:hypothetical protein
MFKRLVEVLTLKWLWDRRGGGGRGRKGKGKGGGKRRR